MKLKHAVGGSVTQVDRGGNSTREGTRRKGWCRERMKRGRECRGREKWIPSLPKLYLRPNRQIPLGDRSGDREGNETDQILQVVL